MSRRRLHVGRIEIRLRGVSAEEARACAGRLGGALLDELAAQGMDAPPGAGAADARGLTRGAEGGAVPANELHRVIARKVAASVRGRLK